MPVVYHLNLVTQPVGSNTLIIDATKEGRGYPNGDPLASLIRIHDHLSYQLTIVIIPTVDMGKEKEH
jgi:hypothetical protein